MQTPTRRTALAFPLAAMAGIRTYAQSPGLLSDPLSPPERAAVLDAVASLARHGLDPEHYGLSRLRAGSGNPVAAWMMAGAHMLRGRVDPLTVEPDWSAPRRTGDLEAAFAAARRAGTLADSLEGLAPRQAGYRTLVAALGRLGTAEGGRPIPSGPTLREGDQGARVEALQARLAALGFPPASPSGLFDRATHDAIIAFQDDAGLDADGLAGPATIGALNRSDRDRRDALRANLERWRWLPDDLGARHVRVNIAGFSVEAWRDGQLERTHLAVVGKPYRRTPVFSDAVRYLVFNPWWETPPSLARADKLPLFKRDPGAVDRLGYQVLDASGRPVRDVDWNAVPPGTMPYRIRQAPGPANALGQVKIMFPNRHNVYLHDTPSRDLFARRQRAFSSGCIRTQDPLALSAWLLEGTPNWDRARIDEVVASGRETRVDLAARVPVHILYETVIAEPDGAVRYLDDIYGRDSALIAALDAAPA